MTREYTGFPISNYRTGFNESVEPWLLPRDSFQVVRNAHLYRGVIEKIAGYNLLARMSYRQEVALSGTINGINKTFTGTLSPLPVTNNITVQSTIDAGATVSETFTDDGTGTLTGSNGGTGSVDYNTGVVSVVFGTNAPTDQTVGGTQYNSVMLAYDSAPGTMRPIMGIKPYISPVGGQDVLVFDTLRVGKIVTLINDMATLQQANYGITELTHETQALAITTGFNNTKGPFTGTVSTGLVPGQVQFQIFNGTSATATLLDTITDLACMVQNSH